MSRYSRHSRLRGDSILDIGVLDLQGDVQEHLDTLKKCKVTTISIKKPEALDNLNGLIIPGGESTTLGKLILEYGFLEPLKKLGQGGLPIYGTCAGLILLSHRIIGEKTDQLKLDLIQAESVRNAFGSQRESFEVDLEIPEIGSKPFPCVFIRAPYIQKISPEVSVLCSFEGKIVAARQNNILVSAFHPELTDDLRFHQYFLTMAKEYCLKKKEKIKCPS